MVPAAGEGAGPVPVPGAPAPQYLRHAAAVPPRAGRSRGAVFLKPDIPSIRTRVRLRSGDLVTLYGLHPEPPAPGEADTSLPRDAELVLAGREIAKEAGSRSSPATSTTSPGRTPAACSAGSAGCSIPRRSGHVQHLPRPLLAAAVAARPCLRQRHLRAAPAAAGLPAFGSIISGLHRLDHAPAARAVQEAPAPDADDHAEARDKVVRAGVAEAGWR